MRGFTGVRLLPVSLVTHSVRRSHDGVTCWGSRPTGKWPMIFAVRWLITSTVFDCELGT